MRINKPHPKYVTSPWRVFEAILGGGLSGGIMLAIILAVMNIRPDHYSAFENLSLLMPYLLYGTIFWTIGIVVFGSIPWLILHSKGRSNLRGFMYVGAFVPAIVVTLSFLYELTSREIMSFNYWALLLITVVMIKGAIVGWVIWRIAYRPSVEDAN